MDENKKGNFAFIDGQNLHSGVKKSGWKLDHKKFREFLKEEFGVTRAYIFIGYMEEQQDLYNVLQEAGFVLFFKPLLRYDDGSVKGNVDAELIVQTLIEKDKYDQAVIVSGDGDFSSMLRHLNSENKLKAIIIPNKFTYSSLFKRLDGFDKELVTYIGDFRAQLGYGRYAGKPAPSKSAKPSSPRRSRPNVATKSNTATTKPARPSSRPQRAPRRSPSSASNSTKPTNGIEEKNRIKSKAQVEDQLLATIAASTAEAEPEAKPAKPPKRVAAKKGARKSEK